MIETNLTLNLSEYEMSVLRGALHEFAEKWPDERGGVAAVLGQIPADEHGTADEREQEALDGSAGFSYPLPDES